MKKLLSIVLTPVFFFIFGLILAIFHIMQIIALRIFGHNAHDKVVAWLNLSIMRSHLILGAKYRFENFDKIEQDKPIIVIANHQSMWDIPALIWQFRNNHLKFIAKKELAKGIPSISYNLRYGGSVTIDRKNGEESIEKIRTFSHFIAEKNYGVCIFPEGSRSRDGQVKAFKIGGLKTLISEMPEALIVPVAIKGTGQMDNGGKFLKNIGVKVKFTMFKPTQINLENIEQDLEEIRLKIKSLVE